MESIEQAKSYIETLNKEYINKHIIFQEVTSLCIENNIEKRDVVGYHGREILELLQNADDAYQKSINSGEKPKDKLEVSIQFIDNCLTVTNTGTVFDKEGIVAITAGNDSPKSGRFIGNKGTGFRSVLNWANKIEIESGPYALSFSKEYADSVFDKIKNEPQIKKQIAKKKDLYIPILAVPKFIDEKGYFDDTTIRLFIDPSKQNDDYTVENQLEDLDLRILLFLPNTNSIKVETENYTNDYEREIQETEENCKYKVVKLLKKVNGQIEKEEIFRLFEKEIPNAIILDNEEKSIQTIIAVPEKKEEFSKSNLYSFFPLLKTTSPFNCVMHGSYLLGDHRDTINRCEANKIIIQSQLDHIIEIAKIYIEENDSDSALSLLIPTEFYKNNRFCMSSFDDFSLQKYYFDKLKDMKMLKTVNGEYLSITDNPKFINYEYPGCFKGEEFYDLIEWIDDERKRIFIDYLCAEYGKDTSIEEEDLKNRINKITESLSVEERVKVFIWWNKNQDRKSLPNLIHTQDGKYLSYGQECYFLTGDFDDVDIPSWVKVPSINKEEQDILLKISENNEVIKSLRKTEEDKNTDVARLVSRKCDVIYPTVKFNYRDRSTIIATVNDSVGDKFNYSVDFVKWLWKNYKEREDWTPPEKVSFKFPCVDRNGINKVEKSELLFFAEPYGNGLAKKLFSEEYLSFADYNCFDIKDIDLEKFLYFISKFGVKKYPEIYLQETEPIEKYKKDIETSISSGNFQIWNVQTTEFKLTTIKNLNDILRKLETKDVVEWILNDLKLFANLGNLYDIDAQVSYRGAGHRVDRFYMGNRNKIKNYIYEAFNEIEWIEFENFDKKFSPRQILKYSHNNQEYGEFVPVINDGFYGKIAKDVNCSKEEVKSIFDIFELCEKVTDLKSEDFYGLMLNLSELNIEKSKRLYEIIYRIIETKEFSKTYEKCKNKEKFMQEGLLLVEHQGVYKYAKAKESYLPSSQILDKSEHFIVAKNNRTNNENFVKVFGCKIYKKEYVIIKESIKESEANGEFQKYFAEFLKFAAAYGEKNVNVAKARALNVTLVKEISVSYDGNQERAITDEYTCIRESQTKFYVTVFGDTVDINTMSEKIETIYSNIADTPGFDSNKIGELFRTGEKSNREFLIKKEFGSLYVIDDSFYQNELESNFASAFKSIVGKPIENLLDIDFDNFNSIENTKKIVELFKENNISLKDFKENGFVYSIDVKAYHNSVLKDYIFKQRINFKNAKFNQALNDTSLQKDFIKNCNDFESYSLDYDTIDDLIKFNPIDKLKEKFGNWDEIELKYNAEEIYKNNYEQMNPDRLFEDKLSNDDKVRTMIYFNDTGEFNKWIEKQKDLENNQPKKTDLYESLRDVIPALSNIDYNSENVSTTTMNKRTPKKAFVQSENEKRNREKKVLGNKGELLIYNLLCNEHGKENVKPISEAFVELNILTAGLAKSGDYDISYTDKTSGIEYFVEVKTGSSNLFSVSEKELAFAMENADRYKLYVVFDVDTENPRYYVLPNRFWENENFRRTDIIEKIEYRF